MKNAHDVEPLLILIIIEVLLTRIASCQRQADLLSIGSPLLLALLEVLQMEILSFKDLLHFSSTRLLAFATKLSLSHPGLSVPQETDTFRPS